MEQDDQMLSPPASTWNITRFQISAWINLNSSALPFLATFVEEIAAARIDSDVISWETGRSDVEVGNLGTQVVPVNCTRSLKSWSAVPPCKSLTSTILCHRGGRSARKGDDSKIPGKFTFFCSIVFVKLTNHPSCSQLCQLR